MANPFDQFDTQKPNPFDQFDATETEPSKYGPIVPAAEFGPVTPIKPPTVSLAQEEMVAPQTGWDVIRPITSIPSQIMGKVVEPVSAKIINAILPPKKVFRIGFGEDVPLEEKTVPRVQPGVPMLNLQPESVIKPESALGRTITGFTTPGQAVTLPLTIAGGPFAKPLQALYAASMVEAVPQQINKAIQTGNREDIEDAIVSTAMLGSMIKGLTTKKETPYAPEERIIEENRQRQYPQAAERGIPPEAVGGNRPIPTAGVEEKAQVSLSPEDAKYLELEREAIDTPVDVVADIKPGEPFARQIATIDRQNGKILINASEYSNWLKDIPQENRQKAVRSLLSEENIHLAAQDTDALGYWKALSGIEQSIAKRRYTGQWSGQVEGMNLGDLDFGHEALRYRMQQLSRMTPREIAEAVGREKWTLHGLDALDATVRNIRKITDRTRSKEGTAILDRIQDNLKIARTAAGAGPSKEKEPEVESVQALEPESGRPLTATESLVQRLGGRTPAAIRKTASEGQNIADELGMRFDGEQMGRWMFTLIDKNGKESTSIITKAGASPDEVYTKYELKRQEYGDQPNAPRKPQKFLTRLAYDLGEKTPPQDLKYLEQEREFLNRQLDEYYARDEQPSETSIAKSQYYGEAIKWRKAIEEAKQNPDKAAEIERKLGVGDFTGKELKAAVDRETKVESVQALDPETGRPLTATESLAQRLGARTPAALRKRKAAEKATGEFILPPLEPGERRPSATEAGAAPKPAEAQLGMKLPQPKTEKGQGMLPGLSGVERISAEGAGAKPVSITPQLVQGEVTKHLASSSRPSFNDFVGYMKRNYGTGVQPGALREVWEDAVWKRLLKAPGKDLELLRAKLFPSTTVSRLMTKSGKSLEEVTEGLPVEKKYGRKGAGSAPIANAPTPEQFQLQAELPAIEAKTAKAKQMAQQKYRSRVITALAEKLIGEAYKEQKPLSRKTISPDDFGYSSNPKQPIYNEIGSELLDVPNVLGRVLTSDAGVERSGRGAMPVSATKRLTLLLDKRTGKAHLVDTYYDGRRGAVLLDPANPSGAHIPIRSALLRFRPVASMLLDEPVQNFHKSWESLSRFNDELGAEVKNRSEMAGYGFPGETPGAEVEMTEEGTPRQVTPSIYRETPGVLESPKELTDSEAKTVLDHIIDEVDKVETPQDIQDAFQALIVKGGENRLRDRDWSVISALRKMSESIQRKNPQFTPDQATEKLLNDLYEISSKAESSDAFAKEILGRYAQRAKPTVPIGTPEKPSATARELAARSRIAPTVTRPGEVPAGTLPEKRPAPEPKEIAPPRSEAELLSPEEQKYIEQTRQEGKQPGYKLAKTPEGLQVWVPRERMPGAIRKFRQLKDKLEEDAVQTSKEVGAALTRRGTNEKITYLRDVADNTARISARQSGNHIRMVASGTVEIPTGATSTMGKKWQEMMADRRRHARATMSKPLLAAAKAVIAAGGSKSTLSETIKALKTGEGRDRLDEFIKYIENGEKKAQYLINQASVETSGIKNRMTAIAQRRVGQRWLAAAKKLREEVQYAKDHWDDNDLKLTAKAAREELERQFKFERQNGVSIHRLSDYVPGRYESELFNDDAIMFGEQRILGRNFRKPKVFSNYYEAIAAGPYIPKSFDIAELVEHRIRQGLNASNIRMWLEGIKNITDPHSNEPVVKDAEFVPTGGEEFHQELIKETSKVQPSKEGYYRSPGPEYELFSLGPGQHPVAVRVGYKDLLDVLTMQSSITKSVGGRALMAANGLAKHGVILILDTFHPFRLGQYALGIIGKEAGYSKGFKALEYRPQDLKEAVSRGLVDEKDAKWSQELVTVNLPKGKTASYTRHQLLNEAIRNGLNVGRLSDAIYVDLVANIPVVGAMNKWTFDKFTRGLMAESAVREFERLNKAHPEVDAQTLMRRVVKDLNIYYGSLGRQGWIRNPTIRDISQLLFLAPQWVEGLVRKDLTFAGRLAAAPVRLAQGKIAMGTIGRGVGRGLAAYFVLTQIINLINRKQTTFQNEEVGHKLDAWIPTGENSGFWLSPLSVFGEVLHDVLRLSETKPNTWEAIRQIGENKLNVWGRMAWVGITRESPRGERLTTTPSVLKTMAGQLVPTPISIGVPTRALLHQLSPSMVSPPPEGAVSRQALSAVGIKVQPGISAQQEIRNKAERFLREEGIKTDTAIITPTDEPSYAKLRAALRNNDPKMAKKVYAELLQRHPAQHILKVMKQWNRQGFTGSPKYERLFMGSLDDREMELYHRAQMEKQAVYEAFLDFYSRQ